MTDAELDQLIHNLYMAKVVRDDSNRQYEAAETALVEAMTALKAKTLTYVTGGSEDWRATVVAGETMTINEPGLRKALSAPVFDRLCDRKLNRNRLQTAIREGKVQAGVVAQFTEINPSKVYIRLSMVKEES